MQTTNYIAHLHRRMPVIFFFLMPLRFFFGRGACSKSCGGGLLQQKLPTTSRVGVDGMNGRRVVGVDPFWMPLPPYTPEI